MGGTVFAQHRRVPVADTVRVEVAQLHGAQGRQDQVLEDLVVLLARPRGEVAIRQAANRVAGDRTDFGVGFHVLLWRPPLLAHDLSVDLGQPILGVDL